ncbi:hypothetical protein TrLO_g8018 [Triparma laevis f. longispina]|uniref:Uncharacterized protein n=1 Tax=Triparma laevis f. longispina TaxID=1714387 RepID=A0A9W7FTB9_9STRA|nr:hypothetical protein TrLO_g8018 [Triparma laevis f. longispina]
MPSKETVTAYLNHTAGAAESICDSAQNSDAGSLDSNSRSSSPPIHDGIHDGIHDNSSNASNASNASNDQQDEEQDDGEQLQDNDPPEFDSSQHELAKQVRVTQGQVSTPPNSFILKSSSILIPNSSLFASCSSSLLPTPAP